MWNHTGNILLHKDDVGKPKPPAVRLPPNDYVYGNHNRLPEDGVKELVHQWKYHKSTKDESGQRDFCKMNKAALKKGVYTSSGFRQVTKDSDDRIKPTKGKLELDIFLPDGEFVYGVPNKPSTPVKKVINNDYGNESEKVVVNNYADMMVKASQKTKFVPAQTKAANLNKEITNMKMAKREEDPVERSKALYKMKKFGEVERKVCTNRKPFDFQGEIDACAQEGEPKEPQPQQEQEC